MNNNVNSGDTGSWSIRVLHSYIMFNSATSWTKSLYVSRTKFYIMFNSATSWTKSLYVWRTKFYNIFHSATSWTKLLWISRTKFYVMFHSATSWTESIVKLGPYWTQHQCINWPFCPWDGVHFFIQPHISQLFLVFNLWVLSQPWPPCYLGTSLPYWPSYSTILHFGPTYQITTNLPYLPTYLFLFSFYFILF